MMYSTLPFRFASFDKGVIVVNFVGDYRILSAEDFGLFLSGSLQESSKTFQDLQGLQIISSGDVETDIEILATRYRSKKAFLDDFTTLHMVVTTLRCNQQCRYCHATAKKEDESSLIYDMTVETAKKTAHVIMQSPSPVIKVEFQGGDSSLNMKAVKTVVEEVERLNIDGKKDVEFVLCTNLLSVNSEDMDYLRLHKFCVSISLDGPQDLHDANRIDCGDKGTYDRVIANLSKMREYVGYENVGALMTATRKSLGRFPEIVDEYVRHGFDQIIFRPLNPYGRCIANWSSLGYTMDEYLGSYKEGLAYIIDLNKHGVRIIEGYTRLLLSRMITPFPTGYVDLQSPAGAGILGVIYDYDGGIYACDEGRMLSEMGDERLYLGSVSDNYSCVFNGKKIREIIGESLLETTPMCVDCVYRMWCGADPARHYATQHDLMGHKAVSGFCKKHKVMFDHLIRLIESNKETRDILFSWVGGRSGGGAA